MNIQKNRKKVLVKKETFWSDATLSERLSLIPGREKSFVIRMALRDWFGLTNSKRGIVSYKEVETIDDMKIFERSECSE